MAEMALAAMSMAGTAATTAAAALPAASSAMSVLQGVTTAGSVLMGFMGGRQERRAGEAAALDAQLNADVARLDGERQVNESAERALRIQQDHVRKVAAARVAFAGSGLDISSGQLGSIEGSLGNEARLGLDVEVGNQRQARANADLRAGQYEAQARHAREGGRSRQMLRIASGLLDAGRDVIAIRRRG